MRRRRDQAAGATVRRHGPNKHTSDGRNAADKRNQEECVQLVGLNAEDGEEENHYSSPSK